MEEERFVGSEEGRDGSMQHRTNFSMKRIWTRSGGCGRISIIATILSIILLINAISLFSSQPGREMGMDSNKGSDVHDPPPLPTASSQPPPDFPPLVDEDHSNERDYSKEAYVTLLSPADPHPWSLGQP